MYSEKYSSPIYTPEFYIDQGNESHESARACLPIIFNLLGSIPESVVDFGCGIGGWLAAAKHLGVKEILGIDGAYVPKDLLRIGAQEFLTIDLANLDHKWVPRKKFDLAISLEVAEHLPLSAANQHVGTLCRTADVVVFSAAIPFQGGYGHINENWPEFWADIFKRNGYNVYDIVRPLIWNDANICWWYRQNILIFANAVGNRALQKHTPSNSEQLSIIHPELYLKLNNELR